jgi:hypothetical protein
MTVCLSSKKESAFSLMLAGIGMMLTLPLGAEVCWEPEQLHSPVAAVSKHRKRFFHCHMLDCFFLFLAEKG